MPSIGEAQCRDSPIFASLLRSSGSAAEVERAHSQIARNGGDRETFLGNLLVQMYGRFGRVENAAAAFERIAIKNVYSWNLMLAVFADNGHLERAMESFEMAPEKDACSWTTMLVAYARNGFVDRAKDLFDAMPRRDLVAWNSMIATYSQNGHPWQAISLHRRMNLEGIKPDELTIISLLDSCSLGIGDRSLLDEAKSIHSTIIRHSSELSTSLKVCNALIHLYGRSKLLEQAMEIFQGMVTRDCISWTSIVAALNQSGDSKRALAAFRSMELHGIKPSSVTMIEALDACAIAGAIAEGRELHARTVAAGSFLRDLSVRNAVLSMYGRCGNLVEARVVFEEMEIPGRDVVTWNAMVAAYARNGAGWEAFELFQRMKLEGIDPDGITVVCIVSACSHSGLARHGLSCVASIYGDFGVEARAEHLNCVLDLLGRIGSSVEEAGDLSSVDEVGVRTLLGACRVHGGGRGLIGSSGNFGGACSTERYVMISNICAQK
ncbi:pentatricopeptide repeat-containing protein At2g33680 isoform X1 [Selaginella moellendorffii]|nr:pentatricopeptide repeat-containing protein At2g33680 isoform X1 [Selaginella moellendorffii]|eukprot:XP_024524656.1 pentatricopeptide repeat-containing protein At2g33680 isoform X1 [Selaginella moellendorffii]